MNNTKLHEAKAQVAVVGAGLAGSEAAYYLAVNGIKVILIESKALKLNPAQKIKTYGELVCTNSLKSLDPNSAHGILKAEMRALGSIVLEEAQKTKVPAGDALAVDREAFSAGLTQRIQDHPNIQVLDQEVKNPLAIKEELGVEFVIVATGPLTTSPLETWLNDNLSPDDLYFYDAIAPVVDSNSLDYSKLYFKDRHKHKDGDDVEADYLNAPLNQQEYEAFIQALKDAEKVPAQNFEDEKFFESCLPVDLMAERGVETARFSCMKPIGLEMDNGEIPHACVQLRRENLIGDAYNLVGFQTRLKYPEQVRVFRMIPGLEKASFNHLGSVHRNTFLNAKKLLNSDLSTKQYPDLFFAGQITGVEGYTESAAIGLYVADQIMRKIKGQPAVQWPASTAIGALLNYILSAEKPSPSNINFGLLPRVIIPKQLRRLRKQKKRLKRLITAHQARQDLHKLAQEVGFPGELPEIVYPAELEDAFLKTQKSKPQEVAPNP